MITSGGGPGVWGLLHALRRLPGRRTALHVSDPSSGPTLGTALADRPLRLPEARSAGYLPALLETCRTLRIDVLIPVYDGELLLVAQHVRDFEQTGTRVLLPPAAVVAVCTDKRRTHALLADSGLLPKHEIAATAADLARAIERLGYPQRRLCVRPCNLAGSRGFHVLDAACDPFAERMLSKPGAPRCTAEELLQIRRAGPADFSLIVSELLEGEELGIDVLADRGRVLEAVVRRKAGPLVHGNWTQITFATSPAEREWVARVVQRLQLDGLLCIDARYRAGCDDRSARELFLLEVNARPGAYIGLTCARRHLLALAIDRLLADQALPDTAYDGRPDRVALRVFADLFTGDLEPGLLSPLPETEECSDARAMPGSAPGR